MEKIEAKLLLGIPLTEREKALIALFSEDETMALNVFEGVAV